jgi:hypothetical protein
MSVDVRSSHENLTLVKLSSEMPLGGFISSIEEYTRFLTEDAFLYQELLVTNTFLLIDRTNKNILAYMSLIADSITLSPKERDGHGFDFRTIPACKIAKLATNKNMHATYNHIGSFMVEIARGIAMSSNETSMSCRFITVDADVEHDPNVCEFYKKNFFVPNEDNTYKKRTQTISMRRDLFS